MKSKFVEWLEAVADTMFSELWQAKALIARIWHIGRCCIYWRILEPGALWNDRNLCDNGFMWNFRI
jgi:hypothetical protein